MTQEDKQLLLQDLCARLPYGVMVKDDMGRTYKLNLGNAYLADLCYGNGVYIETPIKPCLRLMSSMTEEEEEERQELWHSSFSPTEYATLFLDFCNERHLDYRGLIDKGLAIEVTEDNNPYKD